MSYTEEEIKKYLNILNNYREGVKGKTVDLTCCSNTENLSTYLGQYICIKCGQLKGHILGKFDINDFDRLHYKKKEYLS